MSEYIYGDVKGYHPKDLSKKTLSSLRKGLSSANPGEVVLLVSKIDALEERCEELRRELEIYKEREEYIIGMGLD